MNTYNFTVITKTGQRIVYIGVAGLSVADARENVRGLAILNGHVVSAISIGTTS